MPKTQSTDYNTYLEIMDELLQPIAAEGVDVDTLKRLYESKLVYLENLRVKCFCEMNRPQVSGFKTFSQKDYELIMKANLQTNTHLHDLIICEIHRGLDLHHQSFAIKNTG